MTKEDKIIQPKLTLGELGIEAVFSKSCQNQPEDVRHALHRFWNKRGCHRCKFDKLVELIHEDGVHEPHESSWSICETKVYNQKRHVLWSITQGIGITTQVHRLGAIILCEKENNKIELGLKISIMCY